MTIEFNLDEAFFNIDDKKEKEWLVNEILTGNGTLFLHSNEIGDSIANIDKVSNIQFKKEKKGKE